MTSYAQMDKYGKDFFIPAMKERGFNHHKTFIFTRTQDNGICNIVSSQILSSKEILRFWCHIWIPEFEVDQSLPPEKSKAVIAKFPSWEDAWEEWKDAWGIENENVAKSSLISFLALFDKFVLPWFDSVLNGEALILAAEPNVSSNPAVKAAIPIIRQKYL